VRGIVADASAILALLQNEPFRGFEPDALFGAVVSAVNLSEVLATLMSNGMPEELAADSVAKLDLDVRSFDKPQAQEAARLRLLTRQAGLSLGDRACLSLALALDLPAATADRAWTTVKVGVEIALIR
jgi:ribonuclease VapC